MGRGEHFSLPLTIAIGPGLTIFCRIKNRFLAYVDLLGVTYSASTLATGYGAYIAQPLLRKAVEGREDTLTEQEARTILEDALRVLFYRDARSINQVMYLAFGSVTVALNCANKS
jgi:20S proteasome alpha/beta subunit